MLLAYDQYQRRRDGQHDDKTHVEDLVEDQAHDAQLNDASDCRDNERRADAETKEEGEDGVEDDEGEGEADIDV